MINSLLQAYLYFWTWFIPQIMARKILMVSVDKPDKQDHLQHFPNLDFLLPGWALCGLFNCDHSSTVTSREMKEHSHYSTTMGKPRA